MMDRISEQIKSFFRITKDYVFTTISPYTRAQRQRKIVQKLEHRENHSGFVPSLAGYFMLI